MRDANERPGADPGPPDEPALMRCLGLSRVTFYGLGTILGAGIYALVGAVAVFRSSAAPGYASVQPPSMVMTSPVR